MEREEKRMEKYSEYYRYKVFGESSNTQLQLEAVIGGKNRIMQP